MICEDSLRLPKSYQELLYDSLYILHDWPRLLGCRWSYLLVCAIVTWALQISPLQSHETVVATVTTDVQYENKNELSLVIMKIKMNYHL